MLDVELLVPTGTACWTTSVPSVDFCQNWAFTNYSYPPTKHRNEKYLI